MQQEQNNNATTGQDSVGKAIRRNLSPRHFAGLVGRMLRTLATDGPEAFKREMLYRYRLATHGEVWFYHADTPLKKQLKLQCKEIFDYMPLFSVIVPLYNTPEQFLREMIESVVAQSYQKWELLLVNASEATHPEVGEIAAEYEKTDSRIRCIRLYRNAGIADNTNIGLAEAEGNLVTLLDHDDLLQPHALYEVVKAVNETGADLVYSDEIVLDCDSKKLGEYHFKPDYGPDTLRGCNYITHLCAFRRELLAKVGGGESNAYNGAQDYDLVLRLSEQAKCIHHIPKVLYFWRRHEYSTARDIFQKPYAIEAGAQALRAHLERIGLCGTVEIQKDHPGAYRERYVVKGAPLVSVVIPNKDHAEDLARCLETLYARAGWDNMEVLVVENNSTDPATEVFYTQMLGQYPGLQLLRYEGGFNFAAICNLGVTQAKGEHILLLNNDIEVLSEDFVRELLSYSQRADVGAVGALLYYPNDEVQHAGLFIGIGGTVGTSHKGHPRGDGGDLFRLCTAQNMSAVTGAAMMLKTALWRELGGMDEENFAVAFNDVDLCLRLREKNYWNVFTPFAEGYHYESKSRGYDNEGSAKQRFDREAAAFRERYAAILKAGDPFYNPHFTLEYENFGYR